MRLVVAAVGKSRVGGFRNLYDDYIRRLSRYARVEELMLQDQCETQLEEQFDSRLPRSRAVRVALAVEGQSWSSERLSEFLSHSEQEGQAALHFCIGGAYGLPKGIVRRADQRLSLSALTYSHRLAKLVLLEQLYRAYTIVRGEPYAH